MWFFLAASSIIIIAIMTWFSYIFNNRPIEKSGNWNDKPEKKNTSRASKVEELNNSIGYYFIYVVNILTNHGKSENVFIKYNYHENKLLNFVNRNLLALCPAVVSDSCRRVAFSGPGIGQQLFQHYCIFSNCANNETGSEYSRRFCQQRRCFDYNKH